MNRAIGAIDKTAGVNSFGMHYQWGRKDPFTPTTIISTTAAGAVAIYNAAGGLLTQESGGNLGGEWTPSSAKASNITVLTSKPSTFYGTSGDLITTPAGASWWNPTAKTLYDPCPSGYRGPPKDTYGNAAVGVVNNTGWGAFISSGLNSGVNWQVGSSFFPASGYRHPANGKFCNVGSSGYAWISTPNSATYGCYLAFYLGAVHPNRAANRSNAFPVRCISE